MASIGSATSPAPSPANERISNARPLRHNELNWSGMPRNSGAPDVAQHLHPIRLLHAKRENRRSVLAGKRANMPSADVPIYRTWRAVGLPTARVICRRRPAVNQSETTSSSVAVGSRANAHAAGAGFSRPTRVIRGDQYSLASTSSYISIRGGPETPALSIASLRSGLSTKLLAVSTD